MTAGGVERLPGVLGHELRNPLASAMTGTLLARELVDDGDPRAAVLDGVLADLQRLVDLTDGWLAVARGKSCREGAVDVGELVDAIAARHGAEVLACPTGVELVGNRALLERAFDNLAENARRAGGRRLRLAVQEAGDDVLFHVEDDGAGVAPEDVRHVFRAGWSKRGGAGLGLHAVAATVRAHGGEVRCVPLPRGTRFSISLPKAVVRTAPA